MEINDYVKVVCDSAEAKGFYDWLYALDILRDNCVIDNKMYEVMTKKAIAAELAYIHDEVSEALRELVKDDMEKFEKEIADIVLRSFSLSGALGIDLEKVINEKMIENETRPYKHGKNI